MTEHMNEAGFSLVELLVVVTILALAAAVAVQSIRLPRPDARPNAAELLETARRAAVRSGVPLLAPPETTPGGAPLVVFPDGSLSRLAPANGIDPQETLGISRRSLIAMELR